MIEAPDDIARLKRDARAAAKARRAAIAPADAARAADALADAVLGAGLGIAGPVAGYWPLRAELDVRPLLRRLADIGIGTCLPAMVEPGAPLAFRRWREGDALVCGSFGVMEPAAAHTVRPALVLVPLLAFDRTGRRLGYGAGFYDRTLAALRASGPPVMALGVAFAAQEVDAVPVDGYDQPLDGVATEGGVILVR